MAKVKSKKGSLVGALDTKISDLIYRLLDEKTADLKRANAQKVHDIETIDEGSNADVFDNIFFAKDLNPGEVYTFCLTKDLSLQRTKKVVLQKTIERVLKLSLIHI